MTPELRQTVIESFVRLFEDDLENEQDFSKTGREDNFIEYVNDPAFFPEFKSNPIPKADERAVLADEAYRIFIERHPEALEALKQIQAKNAAELAELEAEQRLLPWERKKLRKKSNNPPKTGKKQTAKYRRAKHAAKSQETWRFLELYPDYEISSFGRIRSAQRAKPDDALKPRFSWHYGKLVACYTLRDREGKRFSRFLGGLMVSAGFEQPQAWMKKARSAEELVASE